LHDRSHRQIAELLADPDQLIHDHFKLTQVLNLLAIDGNQVGIGQPLGNGLGALLACQQRVRAMPNQGTIGMFDREILFREGTPPQFPQAGELLEERLALVFQVRVIRRFRFHIVVRLLQFTGEKQTKTAKPSFISSTPLTPPP
jgi:hypothetical protein